MGNPSHPPLAQGEFQWSGFLQEFACAAEAQGFISTTLAELEGGPLTAWERTGTTPPSIYLSAGMHGDEPAGPLALLNLMRDGFFTKPIHWLVCPALNPTGLATSRRENAQGIDLNRDYWQLHTPEVSAHTRWLHTRPTPDVSLSLHEDWETTGFYFYEINLGTDDPHLADHILTAVRPWFHPETGPEIDGHTCREPGWIYHPAEPDLPEGWPEAIYLVKHGCPLSLTFETPSSAPLHARVAAHQAAIRAACAHLIG